MPALRVVKQKIQGAGAGAGAGALLVTNCHFHEHPAMQSRKYVWLMMMLAGYYNPIFINYRDRIIIMLLEIFIISLPCLISVVPQIEPVPLFVGVNVQVGERAEDLLEGEEGGGDSLGLIVNQLLAGHSTDLNKSM